MKALVVYDSAYGNTEQVAKAIAAALGEGAAAARATEVTPGQLQSLDLLIVGSPTQGGRPLPSVVAFIGGLGESVRGTHAAAFDTRVEAGGNFFLRALFAIIGFAAPKIAKELRARDATLVGEPAGFVVEGKEGPVRGGELERAAAWARSLGAP